jgi:hypothetical protein
MRNASSVRAVARCFCAALVLPLSTVAEAAGQAPDFPALPLPPHIEALIGLPQTPSKGRSTYLPLLAREAEMAGVPPDLVDAVARVESGFDPEAVGKVGEIGLMQVRPETAAMLGYRGPTAGLFAPETNVRYGVAYLSRAWQFAKGDVCRALMKYRSGWGEERMTPLSVEYCRRAREHLAAIGSPIAEGGEPRVTAQAQTFGIKPPVRLASLQGAAITASRVGIRVISFQPAASAATRQVNTAASTRINASGLEKVLAAQAGCQVRVRSPGTVRCYQFARR